MRWLAIHLPRLALEVFSRASETPDPLAVVDRIAGVRRILLCNPAAANQGVRPGLSPDAARAMVAGLRVLERKPQAEREALERLADWSGRFTSRLSLEPPRTLLLEVAGSRKLFGGVEGLIREYETGLGELGYHACLALAPTPIGAAMLAAAGRCVRVGNAELRRQLAPLPLQALSLTPGSRAGLQGAGLRTIGDLLRLPRESLVRRLGQASVSRLDRALGRAPDPRPNYAPPVYFQGRLLLPAEVASTEGLVFAARRLLLELSGFLRARGLGAQGLDWRLEHTGRPATEFCMQLLRPERDARHFLDLLRQRLERMELAGPVTELVLRSAGLQPFTTSQPQLFTAPGRPQATADPMLVERLQARLGAGRVRGICLVPEHRPELAWRYCSPGGRGGAQYRRHRPLWLLAQPQPLAVREGRPCYGGSLELEPERERIETGWWDDQVVRRDYFVAYTPAGERLWIFRELNGERRWFLHGFYN